MIYEIVLDFIFEHCQANIAQIRNKIKDDKKFKSKLLKRYENFILEVFISYI